MARFIIEEKVIYEVEADDEEHALDIFLGSEDIDEFLVAVEDREVYPA